MIAVSDEPATAETPSEAEVEAVASFLPKDLLAFVLAEAGARDRRHAHLYDAMDAARVREAAALAQQLLATHRTLMGRWGRQARTGRKAHRDAIYALLRSSNEAALVLAMSFLEVGLVVFDTRGEQDPGSES